MHLEYIKIITYVQGVFVIYLGTAAAAGTLLLVGKVRILP